MYFLGARESTKEGSFKRGWYAFKERDCIVCGKWIDPRSTKTGFWYFLTQKVHVPSSVPLAIIQKKDEEFLDNPGPKQ